MQFFRRLRNFSMQSKITAAGVASAVLSLFGASVIFALLTWTAARNDILAQGESTAELLAMNLSTSLLFEDAETAQEMLAPLAESDNILSIVLIDNSGAHFVEHGAHTQFGYLIDNAVTGFSGKYLISRAPVLSGPDRLGHLYVVSYPHAFFRAIRSLLFSMAAVLLLSIFVAYILSRYLSRRILKPVNSLADAMSHVRKSGDLSRRIMNYSCDEVG